MKISWNEWRAAEGETEFVSSDDGTETFTSGEYEVDIDDNDTELEMAAKFGKALLDQNKYLRTKIDQQKIQIEDQIIEIQYLKNKLITSQKLQESRLEFLDNVLISTQELEEHNLKLEQSRNDMKFTIQNLKEELDGREEKCESLEQELKEVKEREQEWMEVTKKEKNELLKDNTMFNQRMTFIIDEQEKRIQSLETKLKKTEEKFKNEIHEREEAEDEIDELVQENNKLYKMIFELQQCKENWESQKQLEKNISIGKAEDNLEKGKKGKKLPQPKSLLSELEEQYCVLIDQYQGLIAESQTLKTRDPERPQGCHCPCKCEKGGKPEKEDKPEKEEKTEREEKPLSDPSETLDANVTPNVESKSRKKRLRQRQRKKLEKQNTIPISGTDVNTFTPTNTPNNNSTAINPSTTPTNTPHSNSTSLAPSTPKNIPHCKRRIQFNSLSITSLSSKHTTTTTTSPQPVVKHNVSSQVAQLRSFERSFADVLKFNKN